MNKTPMWVKLVGALFSALLTGGAMLLLFWGLPVLKTNQAFLPEIALTFLIIGNLVALILMLITLALVFSALELTDGRYALGFPEGTVRAIIALGLILIFITTSVYLFNQLESTEVSVSRVPASLLDSLDGEIISLEPVAGAQSDAQADEDVIYTVRLIRQVSEERQNLAQQLTTTISTLVVAVAGFYFGTRAVHTARDAVKVSEPIFNYLDPMKKTRSDQDEAVSISAHGSGFQLVKVMKLVQGANEIVGRDAVTNGAGTEIKAQFDFKPDTPVGKWDLLVQFVDEAEPTARLAFTLEGAPPA